MKSSRIVALVSMVLTVRATPLLAKRGTIGIYAIVDKVAFEPNETSPERVRICGVFVVPVPMSSGQYKAPQRGCLYFRMAPGMERIAEHDWRDLKAFAGTGQGVGFAQYWVPNPADPTGNPHHSLEVHVHNDGDAVSPDMYPLPHGRGIVRTGDGADPDFERIVAQLQRAARRD
jgi:hypothetical protein